MILKTIMTLMLLLIISSCGRLSHNLVNSDKMIMRDARINGEDVKTTLNWNRYQWFAQATMHYDLLLAQMDKDSPYFQWFSPQTQKDLLACGRFFISAKYAFLDTAISHGNIRNQFIEQGVEEIVPTDFLVPFRSHYFFFRYALNRYKIVALCQKGDKPLKLKVQGYKEVTIP